MLTEIVSQLPHNGLKVVQGLAALSRTLVHRCGRAGSVMRLPLRHTSPRERMTASHVRRDKAALIQRVQAPPGDRSSRKQPGQAWR
jgi:hypothetical protein